MLVDTYVPSFFAGILLGAETSIPESIQEAFKETGTSHIIAIVSGLYAQSCGRVLGLYRGVFATLVTIAIYTILVGGDAAAVRAVVMRGIFLFAGLIGRTSPCSCITGNRVFGA